MVFTNVQQIIRQKSPKAFIYAQVIVLTQIYRFKRFPLQKISVNVQYSKKIWFTVPEGLLFKVYKHRLVMFGRKLVLNRFLKEFQKLRPPSSYTAQGLQIKPSRYRVKPGKIRRK